MALRMRRSFWADVAATLLVAGPAMAAEAEGAQGPTILELIFPAINFAIFGVIVVRGLGRVVREYFAGRRSEIGGAIAEAERARAEAMSLRAELEGRVAALPEARARIVAEFRAAADEERKRLLAAAQEAAERIRVDAHLAAAQEVRAAREALRREVVETAVRRAAQAIRERVTPGDHERLLADFVGAVGA